MELGSDMDNTQRKRCRSIKMGVVGAMAIPYNGHPALIREPVVPVNSIKFYVTRRRHATAEAGNCATCRGYSLLLET